MTKRCDMNCNPYAGPATINQRNTNFPSEPVSGGIDLNPYLNFLLDLNTLDLTGQQQQQQRPVGKGSVLDAKLSRSLSYGQAQPQRAQPVSGSPVSNFSAKDITSRLHRLEVQLSKIVNSVVKDASSKQTHLSSRLPHCLSPVTADEGDNESVQSLRRNIRPCSKKEFESEYSRKKTQWRNGCASSRSYRLWPPASFEDEEPKLLPVRIKSRTVARPVRKTVSEMKIEAEVRTLEEDRENLEAELSTSQEELKKFKSQSDVVKDEAFKKLEKCRSSLVEEVEKRQKAEKNLEVHKKLASGLNAKFQASEQREQQLQSTLVLKESALTTLNCLHRENQTLKDEIRRLNTLTSAKRPACHHDSDKDITRRSVDEALKKATTKFTKFHKDEVRHFELQIRNSQEVIRDLEAQIDAIAAAKEGELTKLRTACSRMEIDVSTSKSREDLQERRSNDLLERVIHAEDVVRLKEAEVEKLQKSLASVRKECDRVKNTVASLHCEKTSLRDLRDAVDDWEKKVSRLEQEKAVLREKVDKLEEDRNGLRSKLGDVEESTKSLKEKHLVELQTRDTANEKLKVDLASQVEAARLKDKAVEELQDTIQKLRRTVETTHRTSTSTADAEHFKRRNRELEEVLERLETRKEELKNQLAATEAQLQESSQAHQIINAKWKEKSAYITRLQTNHATLQARFEVREEELTQERDEALERIQTLETKVEELTARSKQLRQADVQSLRSKYEYQLAKKESTSAKIQQQNRELEERLQELTTEITTQKKQISGKFTRLGKFLQDFENDF